jgi:hypothetical protein
MGSNARPPLYAWVIFFACAAFFLVRGPIRATAEPKLNMDAPLLLVAAATWRHGGNPYDPSSVASTFGDRASSISSTLERGAQAFVYSPPAYALLSPLTYLPWSVQRGTWNILNSAMMLLSFILVCKIFGTPLLSLQGFAILAIGLAANPGHVNIAFGQTGAPRQMINLQSPLAVLTGSSRISTALAISTCALMGLAYAWIDRQAQLPQNSSMRWLTALSAAAILMLLIFYHRIYDAVFLMVPAALAVRQIGAGNRRGWAVLALLVPLWVPISSTMYHLVYPTVVTANETHATGAVVYGLLVQHQTWFLIAAFLMVCDIRRADNAYIGPR